MAIETNDPQDAPRAPGDDAELEGAAAEAARLFLEIQRGIETRPVSPGKDRAALRDLLAHSLADVGVGLEQALADFERLILPNAMGIAHPMYMGLVNSSPLPAGALGDLLVSALNNNAGAFSQGPGSWACERELVRCLVELIGLPERADGMLVPGGTFANLQGILLARTRAFGARVPESARLYTSEAAHFSVGRAARVIGLADEQVVALPATGRGALDVRQLERRLHDDGRRGLRPFVVVANAGTTGTGAIDPLHDVAHACRDAGVWLHVDACYGGAALLLPELRPRFAGIEAADSVAIDPQKWFFVPIAVALLLTAHPERGEQVFAAQASSYIPQDGEREPWLWGLPTSRRASAVTVWLTLRAHGFSAVRDAVRRNVALMRALEERLRALGFDVLPDGELSVACARAPLVGGGAAGDAATERERDDLQVRIAARVVASGRAWFATLRHAGRVWLRFNLLNVHTRERHVERLVELVADAWRAEAGVEA
jgi:glutamate/tyrosine decarboxylase-like PLP-dependent enzyme